MRRLGLLPVVAGAVLLALSSSSALASSGTLIITSDTTLTEDHFGSVVIAADNVTLDCAGFRIAGPGESGNGVTFPGTNAATVKNCTVTGFDGGFNIQGSDNVLTNNRVVDIAGNGFIIGTPPGGVAVEGNTLRQNVTRGGVHGFWLVDTSGNRLRTNTATGSDVGIQVNGSGGWNELRGNLVTDNGFGILLYNTSGNVLFENRAAANEVGFVVARSTHNVLVSNTATGNIEIGFWLSGASRNLVTGNIATGNGNSGTYMSSGFMIDSWEGFPADDNVLTGNVANGNASGFMLAGHEQTLPPVSGNVFMANTANGNTWFGFGAWRATGNTWQDNTANDNGHWGFALFNPCLSNTLTGNVGRRNGEFDAYDDDIPVLNTWTNNKFAKTSPKGL